MRLYEFTDPNRYLLPKTDAGDRLKQRKNIKTANTADTVRRLSEKLETKKPKGIL
jgi:hypothetical protein